MRSQKLVSLTNIPHSLKSETINKLTIHVTKKNITKSMYVLNTHKYPCCKIYNKKVNIAQFLGMTSSRLWKQCQPSCVVKHRLRICLGQSVDDQQINVTRYGV